MIGSNDFETKRRLARNISRQMLLRVTVVVFCLMAVLIAVMYAVSRLIVRFPPGENHLAATTSQVSQTAPATTTDAYAGWTTYTNAYYHYTLRYPPTWTVIHDGVPPISDMALDPRFRRRSDLILSTPNGDTFELVYDFPNATGPFHFYRWQHTTINGEAFAKLYNDACSFDESGDGTIIVSNCDHELHQVTFSNLNSNTSGLSPIDWGSSTTTLVCSLHGQPSQITFSLKTPRAATDAGFTATDHELDLLIASLKFL